MEPVGRPLRGHLSQPGSIGSNRINLSAAHKGNARAIGRPERSPCRYRKVRHLSGSSSTHILHEKPGYPVSVRDKNDSRSIWRDRRQEIVLRPVRHLYLLPSTVFHKKDIPGTPLLRTVENPVAHRRPGRVRNTFGRGCQNGRVSKRHRSHRGALPPRIHLNHHNRRPSLPGASKKHQGAVDGRPGQGPQNNLSLKQVSLLSSVGSNKANKADAYSPREGIRVYRLNKRDISSIRRPDRRPVSAR